LPSGSAFTERRSRAQPSAIQITPDLDDPATGHPVHRKLLRAHEPASWGRARVHPVRAQPAAVDQQMPEVPVVVRERLDDRGQSLGVSTEAQPLTVHLDIPLDELAELVEPVLVQRCR